MPRRSSLNFPQPSKITSFKIAISMFKLPQRRFGRSSMKDITDCQQVVNLLRWGMSLGRITFMESIHIELTHKGRNIGMLKVLPGNSI